METQAANPNPQKSSLSPVERAAIEAIVQRISLRLATELVCALGDMVILARESQPRVNPPQPTAPVASETEVLKVADAAKILKLSRAKVYRMIQTQEIPSISIGHSVRLQRQDVDSFIEEHQRRS